MWRCRLYEWPRSSDQVSPGLSHYNSPPQKYPSKQNMLWSSVFDQGGQVGTDWDITRICWGCHLSSPHQAGCRLLLEVLSLSPQQAHHRSMFVQLFQEIQKSKFPQIPPHTVLLYTLYNTVLQYTILYSIQYTPMRLIPKLLRLSPQQAHPKTAELVTCADRHTWRESWSDHD